MGVSVRRWLVSDARPPGQDEAPYSLCKRSTPEDAKSKNRRLGALPYTACLTPPCDNFVRRFITRMRACIRVHFL